MNYPYAIGTIKVIESQILDKAKLSKLFKTDKKAFLKSLSDYGYGQSISTDNLEKLINSEFAFVKNYLDEISPNKKLTDLFFLVNDAINIKILYKNKLFGVSNDYYTSVNSIEVSNLSKAILADDFSNLNKEQIKLIKQINQKVININSPRLLSTTIENSIFDYVFARLGIIGNDTLKVYYKAIIDFTNVISLIRAKTLKWNNDNFANMFVNHGTIDLIKFQAAYDLSNDDLVKYFENDYLGQISLGLKSYFMHLDLNILEKHFDIFMLKLMKEYQYDSFSIGPIIYYYLKKEAEAKNIRLLYDAMALDLNELLDY